MKFLITTLILVIGIIFIDKYIIDLKGVSIKGVYICTEKYTENVYLNKYYSPKEVYNKGLKLGFVGNLNSGFGEKDLDGNSVHLMKEYNGTGYSFNLGRTRNSNWAQNYIKFSKITNSCTIPNKTIRKDTSELMNELNIETDWVKTAKIRYYFDLPWYKLTIL